MLVDRRLDPPRQHPLSINAVRRRRALQLVIYLSHCIAHGYKLFRHRWVNANRGVEHRFRSAAFHRDREALHDLSGVGADHMQAHHTVGGVVDNQFHQGALGAAAQRVFERFEVRAIDAHRPKLRTCLLSSRQCRLRY